MELSQVLTQLPINLETGAHITTRSTAAIKMQITATELVALSRVDLC